MNGGAAQRMKSSPRSNMLHTIVAASMRTELKKTIKNDACASDLKDALNLKRALHCLHQGNKGALAAESVLAADQQASTKAILLTKSAML